MLTSLPGAEYKHTFQKMSEISSDIPKGQSMTGQGRKQCQASFNAQEIDGQTTTVTPENIRRGMTVLSLDDEEDEMPIDLTATEPEGILAQQAAIVDLTLNRVGSVQRGDYMTDEQLHSWLQQHTPQERRPKERRPERRPTVVTQRRVSIPELRNGPILSPLVELTDFNHNGVILRPNVSVELDDGDFMRIVRIIRDGSTSDVRIRGWLFRRAKEMNALLEKKLNEVCWILHVDEDDQRDAKVQALEEVSVSNIIKRRCIKVTNLPFPELSYRFDVPECKQVVYNERVLVCRWKYICSYANARARSNNAWCERALLLLRREECDGNSGVSDESRRHAFRDRTVKGGACFGMSPNEEAHLQRERTVRENARIRREPTGRSPLTPGAMMDFARYDTPYTSSDSPIDSSRSASISLITESDWNPSPSTVKDWLADDVSRNNFCNASIENPPAPTTAKRKVPPKIDLTGHEIIEVDAQFQVKSRQGMFKQKWHITTQRSWPFTEPDQNQGKAYQAKRPRKTYPSQFASRCGQYSRTPTSFSCSSLASSQTSSEGTVGKERSPSVVVLEKAPVKNSIGTPSLPKVTALGQDKSWTTLTSSPTARQEGEFLENCTAGQRYVLGDGFCGAGGTSRGALMAGLHVDWGFDMNEHACNSWTVNFPYAKIHCLWADEFATHKTMNPRVDVLHLSPPCQFFSPAHTTAGRNDEQNVASSFAITYLLKKTKPRIVTIENTSGLVNRHFVYMNAVVHLFTSIGFSIRWKILNFADFGVPQRRIRLVVIASCPGEALPHFPKPTHSSNPQQTGLKPWATTSDHIAHIPAYWPDHNTNTVRKLDRPPTNGDTLLKCMTTNGQGQVHPSGRRAFTNREWACLQGFPLEHRFGKKEVKKQIGNAVPPIFAKALMEHIKKSLMKADGLPEVEEVEIL
ncbi:MAG: hypothetical protein Q9187_003808 [Circinaria calcarea]